MIVDTSVIVAILLGEPEADEFSRVLVTTPDCRMSVISLLETTIALNNRGGPAAEDLLEPLLAEANVELVPVSFEQIQAARQAWQRFGKRNHPAKLNFGDCVVYGLAATFGEPLLFKGDDFALTDIEPAWQRGL
ncbi:MAG: type II toxin-antitoxin system VapC family toxin [Chloroflexota bacterium]|nr:type II toxin-antitoxin system VapC family toxin [Chloroflexota bacterium]